VRSMRLAKQVKIAIESTKLYFFSERLVLFLKFVDVRSQLGLARQTAEVEAYLFTGPKRWLSSRPKTNHPTCNSNMGTRESAGINWIGAGNERVLQRGFTQSLWPRVVR